MDLNKQHLENVKDSFQKSIEKLKVTLDQNPEKDTSGDVSSRLAGNLRIYYITSYLLSRDKKIFITGLKECVLMKESLIDRYNKDEPISKEMVNLYNYKTLFDALATGDIQLAKQFAAKLGGNDFLNEKDCHPFAYTIALTLKYFTLRDEIQIQKWLPKFEMVCGSNFQGYVEIFNGILKDNIENITTGFDKLIQGHKKEAKRGIFQSTPDEYLCVWGLGLANMARYYGFAVEPNDPLIPAELLIPVK